MTDEKPPKTIPELWYRIDKRLSLMETSQALYQAGHCKVHDDLDETLEDHETRLRTGFNLSTIISNLIAFAAALVAFFYNPSK